jgi:hypothetical protein
MVHSSKSATPKHKQHADADQALAHSDAITFSLY